MTLHRRKWLKIVLLAAAAIQMVTLLRAMTAKAPQAGMVSRAGHIIVVSGASRPSSSARGSTTVPIMGQTVVSGPTGPVGGNVDIPLYLLDTATPSLMVYIYDPDSHSLCLKAARKLASDLHIGELNNKRPFVGEVKKDMEKVRKR